MSDASNTGRERNSDNEGSSSGFPENFDELLTLFRNPNANKEFSEKLHDLLVSHNSEALIFLLDNGYKIDVINEDTKETIIHHAYNYVSDSILSIDSIFLKCKSDINYLDKKKLSHLHIACATGNINAVKYFIENLDEDINIRAPLKNLYIEFYESEDCTPLHFAAVEERENVVDYLLRKGAPGTSVDSLGRSPLHLACIGYENLRYNANAFIHDALGCLDYIQQERENVFAFKLLVKCKEMINFKDESGRTPMFHVPQSKIVEYFDLLRSHQDYLMIRETEELLTKIRRRQKEKLEILLSHGADVTIVDKNGNTILHAILESLIPTRCTNFSVVTYFDDTLVADMIKMCIAKGADVNAKNSYGKTALDLAVALMSFRIVQILLRGGAKLRNVKINFFETKDLPLCLEAVENLTEIIQLLHDRDYNFSSLDNLFILRSLAARDCNLFDDIRQQEFKKVLYYGTDYVVSEIMKKHYCLEHKRTVKIFENYMLLLESAGLYRSDLLKEHKVKKPSDDSSINMTTYVLQSIRLGEKITAYDILKMNPTNAYFYLKNSDYKKVIRCSNFRKLPENYHYLIKGHFAKILTKYYLVKLTMNYFKLLVKFKLPDICCKMILDSLENEDLCSVCLAGMHEDLTKKKRN